MLIRTFAAGDDVAQVGIYNEAAADLPKFKPATLDEVRRRTRPPEFDPSTRFVAVEGGRVVGYASFHPTGRVSFPWTRRGSEAAAGPLFDRVLEALRARGVPVAFAAYRADWEQQRAFFLTRGFEARREVINFVMDLAELPTPAARARNSIDPLTPDDLPAVLALAPRLFRARTPEELGAQLLRRAGAEEARGRHLFASPHYPPGSLFALRPGPGAAPVAVGALVDKPGYADPRELDAAMPCFRAGAFGAEEMAVKRTNGLFSVAAAEGRDVSPLALDLLGHAAFRLQDSAADAVCAQVPSDAAHLVRFYKQFFRRQGAFPLYERQP
jgi:hypothetical protein